MHKTQVSYSGWLALHNETTVFCLNPFQHSIAKDVCLSWSGSFLLFRSRRCLDGYLGWLVHILSDDPSDKIWCWVSRLCRRWSECPRPIRTTNASMGDCRFYPMKPGRCEIFLSVKHAGPLRALQPCEVYPFLVNNLLMEGWISSCNGRGIYIYSEHGTTRVLTSRGSLNAMPVGVGLHIIFFLSSLPFFLCFLGVE